MGEYKPEMNADEGIERCIKVYGEYSISSKFPNVIDGLKPVHRRILLTLHDKPGTQKEATLAGRVMEIHPHGDAAISDAIAGMAQPFTNIIPLVSSRSNLGTYVGERPAAARYVDVCEAEIANDLFFAKTDKSSLHWMTCETEDKVEPKNFVPVIPTALCVPMTGIAVGFRTDTYGISVKDICAVAKKFVELKYKFPDTWRKKVGPLAKHLLPDFPSYCTLRNSEIILREYSKGNFKQPFLMDGIITIYKDNITISTLPPGRSFGSVTADAGYAAINEKNSWFAQYFSDMADYGDKKQKSLKGNFRCVLRRGVNPFDILAKFKKQMQLVASWSPTLYYFDAENEVMTSEDPISLLNKWCEARSRVVIGGLNQQLMRLFEQFHKIKALVIVADHAKEVCDIFLNAKSKEDTVPIISKKFGLTRFQAKYLQSLPLEKVTKTGKDELLRDLESVRVKITETQAKQGRIGQLIVEDIEAFEKKYAHQFPAKCTIPNYIGVARYKKTGWVQFETLDECDKILADLGGELEFSLYSENRPSILGAEEDVPDNVLIPKYIKATFIGADCTHPKHMAQLVDGGAMLVAMPPKNFIGELNAESVPVGDKFRIVTKDSCSLVESHQKLFRAARTATSATMKNVIFVSGVSDEDVVVVHCNPKVPGVVIINRIVGNGRISSVVIGKTIILGVFKSASDIMFSIPDTVAVRTPIRHMFIKNVQELVEPGRSVQLQLTKRKTSTGRSLSQRSKRSEIYTVV